MPQFMPQGAMSLMEKPGLEDDFFRICRVMQLFQPKNPIRLMMRITGRYRNSSLKKVWKPAIRSLFD
jgi:hypothetical protein